MFLRPFIELRDKLYEKYGIEEITPAMCYAVADYPVVSKVTATSVTNYLNQTLDAFEEFYHKLVNALNEAYVVEFKWDGQERKVVLMKSGGYVFKHHARFDDSDKRTHLDLEYDEKTNTFLAYCNAVSSKNNAIERAKRRMSDVYLKKIKI
jgi:ribosomal protein S8